ncbi:MAG: LysM peptidoglycan-binding domain-containing protein [Candidatus Shapirobacteria bacterium]|nr:LysM peptidoglycan-binding domain-containing protein [Candidatus Shapirobacteria bacterium]
MAETHLKNFLKKIKLNESTISFVLGILVVAVVGVLIFNYFKGVGKIKTENNIAVNETNEVKIVQEEGKFVPEGLPTTYKVQVGDNLWKIAEKFYTSGYNWVDIAKENKLGNGNRLLVGQELTLPKTEVKKPVVKTAGSAVTITGDQYIVVKGDSLWTIAVRAYQDGYQWTKIARENSLSNPNIIHPGNSLIIPR